LVFIENNSIGKKEIFGFAQGMVIISPIEKSYKKQGGSKTSLQWGILLEPKILYEILGGHLSQIFE